MMRALSTQQEHVLIHIFNGWISLSDEGRIWGVRWATSSSRSEAASLSRTLRRLEERGLIIRQNGNSGNNATAHLAPNGEMSYGRVRQSGDGRKKGSRTLSITMLPAGIRMAERLTNQVSRNVNRSERRAA